MVAAAVACHEASRGQSNGPSCPPRPSDRLVGSGMTSIMWFRRDLRLRDHPALRAAAERGPVLGLFVLDPALWGSAGPARRAWLAASLRSLDESMGGRLCVRLGRAVVGGAADGSRGRAPAGARDQRLHALRPGPRPGRRRGAPGRRRGGGHRDAVRRRAGHDHERLGQPLQGVHAVQQGLAQPRLGRPGAGAAQRRLGRRRLRRAGRARCSTRRCARHPTGCRRPARTPPGAACGASSTATSTATTTCATTRAPTGPHGSRPT